jgi:hypothetical protein
MASDDLCNLELYSMEDLVREKDCDGILEFRKKTKKLTTIYKTFLENLILVFITKNRYNTHFRLTIAFVEGKIGNGCGRDLSANKLLIYVYKIGGGPHFFFCHLLWF